MCHTSQIWLRRFGLGIKIRIDSKIVERKISASEIKVDVWMAGVLLSRYK